MASLVEKAIAAYKPTLEEQARRSAEADVRRKREHDEARAEAIAAGEAVLDRVLGQHDGVRIYCLLGGMGGASEIRNLTSAAAVRTIVYSVDGLADLRLAVRFAGELKAGTVSTALYLHQRADSDQYGWSFSRPINDLHDLGRVLHERQRDAS